MLEWLIGFVSLGWLVYMFALRLLTPKPIAGIPHSGNVKAFGDLPDVLAVIKEHGSILPYFDEVYKRHGPIAQIFMASHIMVALYDSQGLHEVLDLKTPKQFEKDNHVRAAFGQLIPNGMLVLHTNDQLRTHRRALAPAISPSYLQLMSNYMATSALQLCQLWAKKRRVFGNRLFSAKQDLTLSIGDVIGLSVFGKSFGNVPHLSEYLDLIGAQLRPEACNAYPDLNPPDQPPVFAAMNYVLERSGEAIQSPVPALVVQIDRIRPRWRRAKRLIWTFLRKELDAARQAASSRTDTEETGKSVLEMLVEKERQGGLKLSDEEILDELFTVFAGGYETSIATIQWSIKTLGRNRRVQDKLYDILKSTLAPLDERLPTYKDLHGSAQPYLEAIVHELARLSPSAGGGGRTALCDTTVLGYDIPKGTHIFCSDAADSLERAPSYHYDAAQARQERGCGYWTDDPTAFRPERWLIGENCAFDPRAGPLHAFGSGVRGCWGRNMAMALLRSYVAVITLSFSLEEVPSELDGNKAKQRVGNEPLDCYVRLRPR